jgi:hypothetical protein
MRVAVMVVTLLVCTSPSLASESCMSMAEARRQFPNIHIYWHGSGHCWDGTAGQQHHRIIHRVQREVPIREVQQKMDRPNTDQPATDQSKTDQPAIDQSKWRDAMSAILPDGGLAHWLEASMDAQRDGNNDAAASAPWKDRWVDIAQSPVVARWIDIPQVAQDAQVASPPVAESKAAVLLITPGGVVLVCIVSWLALGTMMVLFGGMIHQRRWGGR